MGIEKRIKTKIPLHWMVILLALFKHPHFYKNDKWSEVRYFFMFEIFVVESFLFKTSISIA